MGHEFRICDSGDWLTYLLGFFLLYPYVVWAAIFFISYMVWSPVLMFISKVANPLTWLLAWGLASLIRMKRPAGQDCDLSYALPDRGMLVAVVTMYTGVAIIVCTRRRVSLYSIIVIGIFTVLYLIALNTNGYLTPVQFFMNLGVALALSSLWLALYLVVVRPVSILCKWQDSMLFGIDRLDDQRPPLTEGFNI